MHNFTHVMPEHRTSGLGEYADGMIEHDGQIGQLLDYLDKAGLTQQHHRRLHQRQRAHGLPVAGRRLNAIPRRKEHQLGRRLARTRHDSLARHDQARNGHQ